MKSLQFFGAAGTVTGSCHLLTGDNDRGLLVDMGMFQGSKEIWAMNQVIPTFNAHQIDHVLLTHAHLDHCGRLPLLARMGFAGNIYATAATRELAEVVMYDAAKIAAMDEEVEPLYTADDVTTILEQMRTVKYDTEFAVGDYKVMYRDAGHILGSASIELEDIKTAGPMKRIVFSGDLGNSPDVMLKETYMFKSADVVLMESTYGDRNHPDDDPFAILASEINEAANERSVLMIPAFSIERTQLLLYMIKLLKREGKVSSDVPVFLDSPMAISATEIFEDYPDLFNQTLQKEFEKSDPFDFPGLQITRSAKQSKRIQRGGGMKVIIAGSGMMTGGRILGHAKKYLSGEKNRILQVGYQGDETLGRDIKEGKTEVEIDGETIPVAAHKGEINNLSAHADQKGLLTWLSAMKDVQKVILIHGEDGGPRETLAKEIQSKMGIKETLMPHLKETIHLS